MSHDEMSRWIKLLYIYNSAVTIYAGAKSKDENMSAAFYFFGIAGLAGVVHDYYFQHLKKDEPEKQTQISGLGDFQNVVHDPPVLRGWNSMEA